MQSYSTKQLLTVLVAFLELQMAALLLKHYAVSVVRKKYPTIFSNWWSSSGICINITQTPSRLRLVLNGTNDILPTLFKNCLSGTGLPMSPVPYAEGVTYAAAASYEMWGDHPYADNRRKIIQECIDQLYTELQRRNINVG